MFTHRTSLVNASGEQTTHDVTLSDGTVAQIKTVEFFHDRRYDYQGSLVEFVNARLFTSDTAKTAAATVLLDLGTNREGTLGVLPKLTGATKDIQGIPAEVAPIQTKPGKTPVVLYRQKLGPEFWSDLLATFFIMKIERPDFAEVLVSVLAQRQTNIDLAVAAKEKKSGDASETAGDPFEEVTISE
jgi:hypothetical protein